MHDGKPFKPAKTIKKSARPEAFSGFDHLNERVEHKRPIKDEEGNVPV